MLAHLENSVVDKEDPKSIDKHVLNSALELGYSFFFPKKDLYSFKVRDVFDGNKVLDRITRGNKNISTLPALEVFLKQHIQYLREHYSIEQNAPLFPGYEGESGKKKLQRHIRKYSIYRDFHDLIYESYKNANKNILNNDLDQKERLKEISRVTGKSERAIKYLLYDRFNPTIKKIRKPNAATSNEFIEKGQNEDKFAIVPQAKPATQIEPTKSTSYMDLLREAIEENKL